MTQPQFDHEKLDVYRVSIELVAWINETVQDLQLNHRNARDQIIRSSQSIPFNIAEGLGKRSPRDRNRYLQIARGSAMESAACLDILAATKARTKIDIAPGKQLLYRIVQMLSKMTDPSTNPGSTQT